MDCEIYAKQEIESEFNYSFPCPFPDPDACIDPQNNIQVDTGYIDSNKDLGINAPPKNSIFYRKITTCAVVNSTSWATNFVKGPADILPSDTSIYYYFGPPFNGSNSNSSGFVSNYTFSVSNYSLYLPTDAYTVVLVILL